MLKRIKILLVAIPVWALVACEQPAEFSPEKDLPEPSSAGANLLMEYCSDCHAPPKPTTHLRGEWKNVLFRMQNHRLMEKMTLLTEEQLATLVEYMDKHAAEF